LIFQLLFSVISYQPFSLPFVPASPMKDVFSKVGSTGSEIGTFIMLDEVDSSKIVVDKRGFHRLYVGLHGGFYPY